MNRLPNARKRAALLWCFLLLGPAAYAQSLPSAEVSAPAIIAGIRVPHVSARTWQQAQAAGLELFRQGRLEEALSIFQALSEKRPQDTAALYGLALCWFNLRRLPEAGQSITKAITAARKPPIDRALLADTLVLQGVILAVQNDNAGALKAVTEAVKLAPANFDAQMALGRARYGAGDPKGAVEAFRAALDARPAALQARFFLATALEAANDYENALTAYRELMRQAPDAPDGYIGLGVLLVKLGGERLAEGISTLQRAVTLQVNSYEAQVTLGRALIQTGRAADALEPLQVAARLAPGNPEPHYQMALAYRRLGKKAEAAAETEIVRRIHEARRVPDGPPK